MDKKMVPIIIAAAGTSAILFLNRKKIDAFLKNWMSGNSGIHKDIINNVSSSMSSLVSDTPQNYSNNDLDIMARTIWGEARSEGTAGMQAVANCIMNRQKYSARSSGYKNLFGGPSIASICQKSSKGTYQFTCWAPNDPNLPLMRNVTTTNPQFAEAVSLAKRALNGTLPDITGGATHYLTKQVYQAHQAKGTKGATSWSYGETPQIALGSHYYFNYNQTTA